jgi:ABC-2 type transport system ATP-binding protein
MSEAIVIDKVSIAYGKTQVFQNFNLSISEGETFGFIGLNGVGKTSLIKTMLGLRRATGGTIRIFGHEAGSVQSKTVLAYLPERFDPPWFLSGMEFVKFSLSLYGKAFDRDLVLRYAERLALDPKALPRRVQTYSKGMRQKLGLIATILTDCKLLILDEPMSGLDPQARALVKDLLLECKAQGKTIFFTSHILIDMEEICDRVAVLHEGTLKFIGQTQDLKRQFASAENLERAFLQCIEKG